MFPNDPFDPFGVPKGDPKVISDTEGEEITPDNPEIVKHDIVENTKEARKKAEETPQE